MHTRTVRARSHQVSLDLDNTVSNAHAPRDPISINQISFVFLGTPTVTTMRVDMPTLGADIATIAPSSVQHSQVTASPVASVSAGEQQAQTPRLNGWELASTPTPCICLPRAAAMRVAGRARTPYSMHGLPHSANWLASMPPPFRHQRLMAF